MLFNFWDKITFFFSVIQVVGLSAISFIPPPLIMRIDRPWFYLLCRTPETNSGEIQDVITLFSGHVTEP